MKAVPSATLLALVLTGLASHAAPPTQPRVTRADVQDFLIRDCWVQSGNSKVPIAFSGNNLVTVDLDGEKSFFNHYYETTTTVPLSGVRVSGLVEVRPRSPYPIELACAKAGCITGTFEKKAPWRYSSSIELTSAHRFELSCSSSSAVSWWSSLVTSFGGNQDDPLNPPVDTRKKK